MTKEHYRILKPIMDAWLEGKTLQYGVEGKPWQDFNGDDPDFDCGVWRIKPPLIEGWAIVTNEGFRNTALFTTKAEAESVFLNKLGYHVVHLVEVPDL